MKPVVGVDVGATNIRAAAVEGDGSCGPVLKRAVPEGRSPEDVAQAVAALCVEAAAGAAPEAVGVGLAGWLEADTGLVYNGPNLGWRDAPFGSLLRAALPGTEVVVVNDLRAIAWGEHLFGAGAGAKVLLVVFLGSGIGSCVIVDGRPLAGASNIACEIGHTRIVPPAEGRQCGCGQLGCLEAYAGGHNIERRVRQDLEAGVSTWILDLASGDVESVTCGTVDQAAAAGDPYSVALWDEVSAYLGQSLGSMITFLNPDRLILGGGVWDGSPELRARTVERIERSASPQAFAACALVAPTLGDQAGIAGAAALARARPTPP
jgi:glucokinase